MAQALLDARMLDIPLAATFFKWIVGDESQLGIQVILEELRNNCD